MSSSGAVEGIMGALKAGHNAAVTGLCLDDADYCNYLTWLCRTALECQYDGDTASAAHYGEQHKALSRAYMTGWSSAVAAQWELDYAAELDTFPVER